MKDEIGSYLWDGTGEPDAEVARLEATLSRFRYTPRPLSIPVGAIATRRTPHVCCFLPSRSSDWTRCLGRPQFLATAMDGGCALESHGTYRELRASTGLRSALPENLA